MTYYHVLLRTPDGESEVDTFTNKMRAAMVAEWAVRCERDGVWGNEYRHQISARIIEERV